MDKVLLILSHGSKAESITEITYKMRDSISAKNLYSDVKVAFMEFNSPSIPEAIADICKEGAAEIIALPMFLYKGNHILHDIPKELKKAREENPYVTIYMADPIGFDERIADILIERAEGALCQI
ncbi:MAG TPA: cobalamin biosynthesis protein CbiX [Thermoanaerobacterales bacterium]|nr:cobalamin biosynthesis protein CbiX [Thermoanaerobacterales bacterium]